MKHRGFSTCGIKALQVQLMVFTPLIYKMTQLYWLQHLGLIKEELPQTYYEMALSPDEHYLSFTTKGSRELWGVRLSN